MQVKDAMKLRNEWGDKVCDHPDFDKEYYLGSNTGEYVCTQCGETFSRNEHREIKEKRKYGAGISTEISS